ncbi:MAG: SMC-Scp complex subunit ScpB [Candidatus Omnitrophota bacterium]|nr:SMC-Scp complex subunit ScpB [Candidatus Omnitrophota bacterium]MBU1928972.1 SMC-Scp complex subunit ScpB [Candidatus Omnitrophota bacterium]MBU2035729.1 SMC-Scp complex subunit ScpB [Candidatus Omnitrophota bacterium]MBU2221283.1 SMC-Scp complex subunit ScpB [Candidatus Omnitrophota bacterium]MBU2258065.1 SMC-Scp complex subunit ScpB [Candidatus Omnitrophota bacterium]
MTQDNVKSAVEALLFTCDKPLTIEQIKKTLDLDTLQVNSAIKALRSECEQLNRGIRVYEVAGGFQMIAAPDFTPFIKKLYKGSALDKLSRPALETLAIIAYKQPVTRLEIESLRKVNIDGMVASLLEKNLIRIAGRKKAPGRPKVYGTTRQFLEHFGLKTLDELPRIKDFPQALSEETIEPAADNSGREGNGAKKNEP